MFSYTYHQEDFQDPTEDQKVEVSEEMANYIFGKPGVVVSFEKGNGCFFIKFVKKENN